MITTHFTADDLEHFASRLASINFRVRFPGGLADYARMRAKQGSYVSRRAIGMLTGVRQTEESFLESMQSKSIGRERHD